MPEYFKSVTALVYKNTEGKKTKLKSNRVTGDLPESIIDQWLERGNIVEATAGDIAEAVAAGQLSPDALDFLTSRKKGVGLSATDAEKSEITGRKKTAEIDKKVPAPKASTTAKGTTAEKKEADAATGTDSPPAADATTVPGGAGDATTVPGGAGDGTAVAGAGVGRRDDDVA